MTLPDFTAATPRAMANEETLVLGEKTLRPAQVSLAAETPATQQEE